VPAIVAEELRRPLVDQLFIDIQLIRRVLIHASIINRRLGCLRLTCHFRHAIDL
jgi:hypothetical protein